MLCTGPSCTTQFWGCIADHLRSCISAEVMGVLSILCVLLCLQEFTPAWHSIVSMFTFMLGGFDFHVFFESKHAVIAIIFFAVYEFLMAIMALNLLIAIMTDSYSKVILGPKL